MNEPVGMFPYIFLWDFTKYHESKKIKIIIRKMGKILSKTKQKRSCSILFKWSDVNS